MKKFFYFMITAGILALAGCHSPYPESPDPMILPENTKVILHFSSQLDPRSATSVEIRDKSYSKVFYYSEDGEILGEFSMRDEIISDFIVQNQETAAYFFKNDSFFATHNSVTHAKPSSNISIQIPQFGPKDVGYIKSLDLFYAYFNMGGSYDGNYRMVLRLFSEAENYDIIIPYYAPSICFDEDNLRFICEISSTDSRGDANSFQYVVSAYDAQAQKFSLDNKIHSIPYADPQYNDNYFLGAEMLSSGNKIYRASAVQSNDAEKVKLILSEIDLDAANMQHFVIKDDYAASALGHPYIIGSADTPMSAHNNQLYIFTSDCHLVTVDKSGKTTERAFPYDFSNLRSVRAPYSSSLLPPSDQFFNSLISVEDNGDIYLLTVSEKGIIQIFRFAGDDTFALVWQANLPNMERDDLMINTFELISYMETAEPGDSRSPYGKLEKNSS